LKYHLISYLFAGIIFLFACSVGETDGLQTELNIEVDSSSIQNKPIPELDPYKTYDSLLISNAADSIWHSTKVQQKEEHVRELSSDTRHLTLLMFSIGHEIKVQLAEDNGMNYVTHLLFYITPEDNWKIYFYDTVNDVRVDFSEWNQE
jgi:hypothetical protein